MFPATLTGRFGDTFTLVHLGGKRPFHVRVTPDTRTWVDPSALLSLSGYRFSAKHQAERYMHMLADWAEGRRDRWELLAYTRSVSAARELSPLIRAVP